MKKYVLEEKNSEVLGDWLLIAASAESAEDFMKKAGIIL